MKTLQFALWALVLPLWVMAAADAASPDMAAVIKNARFVSYTPRSFSVVNGQTKPASLEGITADLTLLRADFDSLITYSCINGLEHVPDAAEKLGYLALIVGIWDPKSEIEIQNAIRLAKKHPKRIIAISIGNEGIYAKQYVPADVEKTRLRLRKALPSIALTTSEPFFLYLKPEYFDFFNKMDLLLPNIHPTFEAWFQPSDAKNGAAFVLNVAGRLQSQYPKPLIVKETGLPSGPASMGYTEAYQSAFWSEILKQFPASETRAFSCFEAFDAPWKPAVTREYFPGSDHLQEAYWGFFTVDGKPKPVVNAIRLIRGKR
jgi:exo-beta-1,3-glucanase (GH17 family)